MRKLTVLIAVVGLGALAVAPAFAGNFYAGASIGNTFFSDDYQDALD